MAFRTLEINQEAADELVIAILRDAAASIALHGDEPEKDKELLTAIGRLIKYFGR